MLYHSTYPMASYNQASKSTLTAPAAGRTKAWGRSLLWIWKENKPFHSFPPAFQCGHITSREDSTSHDRDESAFITRLSPGRRRWQNPATFWSLGAREPGILPAHRVWNRTICSHCRKTTRRTRSQEMLRHSGKGQKPRSWFKTSG